MLYSVTNLFNILNIKFLASVNPVVEQKPTSSFPPSCHFPRNLMFYRPKVWNADGLIIVPTDNMASSVWVCPVEGYNSKE